MSPAMAKGAFDLVGHEFFTALCGQRQFQPLNVPAERHGSWEWAFGKRTSGLERFVVIAFTDLPAAFPDSGSYTMEVWACAEKNERYTRKPVSALHVTLKPALQEPLRSALVPPILQAMTMADKFTDRDLDEAYVGPRSREGEDPKKRPG